MEASAPATSTTEVKFRKVAGFGGSGNSPEGGGGGGDGADSSSSIPPAEGVERNPSTRSGSGGEVMEYFGWVYHLGTNTIGHQYCHLRFLIVRGKRVYMFKRDPHQSPGIKPIRKGAVWPTLMVEEIGRRKVNNGDLYVIRFYNRLDEAKKGEIACGSAGEARTWMEAFDHAKQQAEFELARGVSFRNKLHVEPEINLEAHRPRVRRYAYDLKKLIRIGQGPETLLRRSSSLQSAVRSDGYFEGEAGGDAIEAHQWRCVRTINGVRIFEDVSDSKGRKGTLVKAVAVVDATADTIFDVVLNVDQHQRNEWDNMTGNLELLDTYDGHCDVVYGTYDPKYLTRWQSSRDFVFSRQWFRGQDGTYTILQFPAIHKKRPPKSGYRRTKVNPSTWEIRNLNAPMGSNSARSIVTQMLEIHEAGWCRWKKNSCSKFEKTIPDALLSQLAGLKEYIGANPALKVERPSMVVHEKVSDGFISSSDYEDAPDDEFYDATAAAEESSSSSSEESGDDKPDNQDGKVKLKNVSWAITSLALKQNAVLDANKELDSSVPAVSIDPSQFHAILRKAEDDNDSNCWTSPNGTGFKIRGKNYLKDYSKVMGGEPLLQLIGVDWFKVNTRADHVALHPRCLVQTETGKKLPFILLVNLQIPAKPNYSLVLYYASDRPVNESSLLGKFVNGTDMFRDSRFKLIPSIIEGYWMVKRAVGTKACLLGKAVTCKYFRQDNFLEIDVDIGSSSVARSVVGLVLGYVTSLVVDLAILVEAKEEEELPEYILGTVRLSRIKLESAVPLEV